MGRGRRSIFIKPVGRRRTHWTVQQIGATKEAVRRELEALEPSVKKRGAHALTRIKQLEQDESPEVQLRCLMWVIATLHYHQIESFLTPSQVDGLFKRAYIILQSEGVSAGSSHHSFLYGDLHQALSLIARRDGDHWRSAWEQQLAEFLSRSSAVDQAGFFSLAAGNRAFRLGNASLALQEYAAAEASGLAAKHLHLVRINRVRIHRLRGEDEIARCLAAETAALPELPRAVASELRWELLCLDYRSERDLGPIVQAVQKGKDHHKAAYVIEAYLWAAAHKQRTATARLPKMRSLERQKNMAAKSQGFLLEAAVAVEHCYDKDVPLILRLNRLGDVLGNAGSLLNVDKELLLWVAAARWLARIHSFKLATLALTEYRALSLRITDGADPDCLRLAGELMEGEWFEAEQLDEAG